MSDQTGPSRTESLLQAILFVLTAGPPPPEQVPAFLARFGMHIKEAPKPEPKSELIQFPTNREPKGTA